MFWFTGVSPPLIPAQAGIQSRASLGPRFRGDERNRYRTYLNTLVLLRDAGVFHHFGELRHVRLVFYRELVRR